ncbi:Conserved_hypothetical protein [Hexamita inflata]|uniref:Uncharacterized protein n=1 Tax=Hexamita inflata TaxID=28002 RepID=A0AA86U2U6_9EUKA|nr:Conserved hypothetical protein [Hexamita inflata]
MNQLILEIRQNQHTSTSSLQFPSSYAFVRWCLYAGVLSDQPSSWEFEVEHIEYEPKKTDDSLNMQVILGELKARFANKVQFDLVKQVVETLQADHKVFNSNDECRLVSNVATFVFKTYLDDCAQHKEEIQFTFLTEPSPKLLYKMLITILQKQQPQYSDVVRIGAQIDPELAAHLQLYSYGRWNCFFLFTM